MTIDYDRTAKGCHRTALDGLWLPSVRKLGVTQAARADSTPPDKAVFLAALAPIINDDAMLARLEQAFARNWWYYIDWYQFNRDPDWPKVAAQMLRGVARTTDDDVLRVYLKLLV
jgi:hypothetical protein